MCSSRVSRADPASSPRDGRAIRRGMVSALSDSVSAALCHATAPHLHPCRRNGSICSIDPATLDASHAAIPQDSQSAPATSDGASRNTGARSDTESFARCPTVTRRSHSAATRRWVLTLLLCTNVPCTRGCGYRQWTNPGGPRSAHERCRDGYGWVGVISVSVPLPAFRPFSHFGHACSDFRIFMQTRVPCRAFPFD